MATEQTMRELKPDKATSIKPEQTQTNTCPATETILKTSPPTRKYTPAAAPTAAGSTKVNDVSVANTPPTVATVVIFGSTVTVLPVA
jgi:hypothetical protein